MKISYGICAAALCLGFALPAAAQNVGVLQSAESIDRGVYKLMLAPIMEFGKNGTDDEFGLAGRAGCGFTDRFDAEAKVGFFKQGTKVGLDGEYWIMKGKVKDEGVDFSLTGGVHWVPGMDDTFTNLHFVPGVE